MATTGAKSDYLENKILDHVLGTAAYTAPTPYLALFTSDPGETGNLSGEVSGGGYARVAISGKMSAASGGTSSNSSALTFPTATADWGTITHAAIVDSGTVGAGNVLYYMALTTTKTILNGDTAQFAAGALSISED